MAKNTHKKASTNFSINIDLEKKFTELAYSLAVNKSALIERYIERWIAENKDRKLQ